MSRKKSSEEPKITEFDKTDIIENDVLPKLQEIEDYCFLNRIPFFYTLVSKSTPTKTEYRSGGIMTGSGNFVLADDKIKNHMMISAGWVARPKYEEEMSMLDVDDFEDEDENTF